MNKMRGIAAITAVLAALTVEPASAAFECETGEISVPIATSATDLFRDRLLRHARVGSRHRMHGLASYYSGFFDGRKTANGEIFRNRRYSAAHLTIPMGTWIEIRSRATGKKLRLRVNDRGPYVKKFAIDLSQAAARYLGVDVERDRYVEFRIIALPGEKILRLEE